jgi:peptide/nickel transport system permease protein
MVSGLSAAELGAGSHAGRHRVRPRLLRGIGLFVAIVAFCFLGPLVYHSNAMTPDLLHPMEPPGPGHPLGTDDLGRSELLRMMIGGQLSLEVAFAAAVVSTVFGSAYGLLSGFLGGIWDNILMRIVDVLIALPSIFLLLLVVSIFKPTPTLLVLVIAFTSWFGVARLVRGEVLSIKTHEYIEAVRAIGAGRVRVMLQHLLPNAMGVVVVTATFQIGYAILTVAGLSFLGLGLPPPTPNWGQMLSDAMPYTFQNAWWLIYPPGAAIVLVELAANFVGDALREAVDPRLREGRS